MTARILAWQRQWTAKQIVKEDLPEEMFAPAPPQVVAPRELPPPGYYQHQVFNSDFPMQNPELLDNDDLELLADTQA